VPTDDDLSCTRSSRTSLEAFIAAFDLTFGLTPSDAATTRLRRVVDPSRFLTARVGDRSSGPPARTRSSSRCPAPGPRPAPG
jgi:hypothetical protein